MEYGSIILKANSSSNLDEICIISKTAYLSKLYESFIVDWLLPFIGKFIDPGQFGDFKGLSTTHYLIQFFDSVLGSLDKVGPNAVIATYIDMSKAFNRIDHNLLIEDIFHMECPAWLLRLLISYLTHRELEIEYHNAVSSKKTLPVGGPAGCVLGGILFIIKLNGALLRPSIPRNNIISKKDSKSITLKYFDDATEAVLLDLKHSLMPDPTSRQRPLTFHEHCENILPKDNQLQKSLNKLDEFVKKNKMVINNKKSKIMMFNPTRLHNSLQNLVLGRENSLK